MLIYPAFPVWAVCIFKHPVTFGSSVSVCRLFLYRASICELLGITAKWVGFKADQSPCWINMAFCYPLSRKNIHSRVP